MELWHHTPDAPRRPARVSAGHAVSIHAGTWPIGPGQAVWVEWRLVTERGATVDGRAPCRWDSNRGVNSYWSADLGPFREGDRITYTVVGASPEGQVSTSPLTFQVGPALHIAWLWHQHQPLYRDPGAPRPAGSYRYPWVRLHALRDYYSMPALAAQYDVHVTFNLTPVLLQQLDDYVCHGATDRALDLTLIRADALTGREVHEILSTFFDVDWYHQLYVHPRYRELFDRRATGAHFSPGEVCYLQMWFNLAWFGYEFRQGPLRLVTGDVVAVARFVKQQRGFVHDDVLAMVAEQYKVLRAVVPLHRTLQETGRIEVTTTPGYHPILPLLLDTDSATIDRPGATHPVRFAHRDDATEHVALAAEDYRARFGRAPLGMWPGEGAVSAGAVQLLADQHVQWTATDGGVLARSGRWGYQVADATVLCQPYAPAEAPSIAIFFRDAALSDGVGFRYGQSDADAAVGDLIRTIETHYLDRLPADDGHDYVLTVVLDGENAWGGYVDDGRPFLDALYRRLSADSRLRTVTFSEYLCGNPARGVRSHPINALAGVHELACGSWIDEPGSAPGVDLGTWIGESEENAAWALLEHARVAVPGPLAQSPVRAHLLAAEGSDWFWWFGTDQESRNDGAFDDLFRAHLRGAYRAVGLDPPGTLDVDIVARPKIWTFTHPLARLPRSAQVTIRTNCPGRLTYRVDGADERTARLVAVGGVMAGVRRFQTTLGPFGPSAQAVDFRFFCEHAGCPHDAPCCRSDVHTIALGPVPGVSPSLAQRSARRSGAHHVPAG